MLRRSQPYTAAGREAWAVAHARAASRRLTRNRIIACFAASMRRLLHSVSARATAPRRLSHVASFCLPLRLCSLFFSCPPPTWCCLPLGRVRVVPTCSHLYMYVSMALLSSDTRTHTLSENRVEREAILACPHSTARQPRRKTRSERAREFLVLAWSFASRRALRL